MSIDPNNKPIYDPEYWSNRLAHAERRKEQHRSIYECTLPEWRAIEQNHKGILDRLMLPHESVLDAGCGYGRLLSLMPRMWSGDYVGIDLSPDFIKLAMEHHPDRNFICAPMETALPALEKDIRLYVGAVADSKTQPKFDWCVMISIRQMIIANVGTEAWDEIVTLLRPVARRLLVLEYDRNDVGLIESLE